LEGLSLSKKDDDLHRGRTRPPYKGAGSADLGRSDKKGEPTLQSEPLPGDAVEAREGKNWIDFLKSLPLY
jgi:hypothetical protein